MRLVIAAASGSTVGAGHVMRSLAVAEAATAAGHPVVFAADLGDLRWVEPWVADIGVELVAPAPDVASLANLAHSRGAEAVLLDSYEIGEARAAIHGAGSLLASFEDDGFGRRAADFVIDYRLGAQTAWRPDDGSATLLRGVTFAPIRAQVRALARDPRQVTGQVTRGAVVLGGGGDSPLEQRLRTVLTAMGVDLLTLERGLGAITALAEADAVVSAAGVSVYELCHLGVPTAIVRAADNQRGNYEALVQAEVVHGLGTSREVSARPALLEERVQRWLADWTARQSHSHRAQALVDGRGAHRIVAALTAGVE